MMFDLNFIDILYIIEALKYREALLQEMLEFYRSNSIEEFFRTEDDIQCIRKVMEKIRGTSKDNQQEERL